MRLAAWGANRELAKVAEILFFLLTKASETLKKLWNECPNLNLTFRFQRY
jgi:hypothetical protein